MEEKVLKLIYDYSMNNRIIDQKFIDQVVEIVVSSRSLDDYLKKVKYFNKDNIVRPEKGKAFCMVKNMDELAYLTYNFHNRIMTIYPDNIINFYKQPIDVTLSDYEMIFFKSIIYTSYILHELRHVDQNRIQSEESSLEAELLSYSNFIIPINESMTKEEQRDTFVRNLVSYIFYMRNHDDAPQERMADVDSYQDMLKILLSVQVKIPNIIKYLKKLRDESLSRGYEDTFSPTLEYYKTIGKGNNLCQFDWYSEDDKKCLENLNKLYSFERRVYCGLPIEEEKRIQLINKIK